MEYAIVGNREAADRITIIGQRGLNLAPVMAVIRELIIAGHRAQFESAGRELSTPWPPLAASTVERKERQGMTSEPLVATGALRTALEGGAGRSTSATKTMVRVGVQRSKLWYAIFAASGASAGGEHPHTEPVRTLTGMTETTHETALTQIQRYVTEGAR